MTDFAETNRNYFNEKAQGYKTDFDQAIRFLVEETQSHRHWISSKWTDTQDSKGRGIKLLDYACGLGAISRALEPFVTKVIGLDIAERMIDEFNKNAREAGVPPSKMAATKGDLLAGSIPEDLLDPDFFEFDIVIVSMALHHFADTELAMNRLGSRMKTGGVLLIIDFIPDHEAEKETKLNHPEAAQTIHKHGFDAHELRELYTNAGLAANFDYQILEKPMEFMMKGKDFRKTVFMARGEKQ